MSLASDMMVQHILSLLLCAMYSSRIVRKACYPAMLTAQALGKQNQAQSLATDLIPKQHCLLPPLQTIHLLLIPLS